ncbi:MAG TPA: hypothetical protein VJ907_01860 [Halanaerobiales bacterium]|nr:hypothetical protein [Halanaerobiales bacterium]
MLFKIICYVLASTAFLKGLVGIFAHQLLYGWAEKHYGKKGKSFTVNLLLFYAFTILILTWYATLFQYTEYGWILTTFITLMSIKTVGLTFKWKKASQKFVSFIKNSGKKLWLLDVVVIILSLVFFGLGYFVY